MAIWHNCSDGWLKEHAFKPYFILAGTVATVALIIALTYWHASVNNNAIVMLLILASSSYIVRETILTKRYVDQRTRTYRLGWVGELFVRFELKRLPDKYHVFYDVRFSEEKGNVDYIVICSSGVYTIEVKNHSNGMLRSSWYGKEKSQALDEARTLHSVLVEHGIDSQWVTSVLVRADQWWKLDTKSEHVDVLGLFSIVSYFKKRDSESGNKKLPQQEIEKIVSVIENSIVKEVIGDRDN